jgi:hypothetical protein
MAERDGGGQTQSSASGVVELLKYPVTVLSILIALVGARFFLGITFGPVTKVGSQGVEFAQVTDAVTKQLTTLESKLNGVVAELEGLKKGPAASGGKELSSQLRADIVEAQQTVSDQVTKLSQLAAAVRAGSATPGLLSPESDRLRGWIWIGDYRKNSWDRVKIGELGTGKPVSLPPTTMQPGTEYLLLANMVVRDGQPANDVDYFNARKSLGILPAGTTIRLAGKPVALDREFAVQWWVEVVQGKS